MDKKKKITLISTESIALNGLRTISSYLQKNLFDVTLISLATFNDSFSTETLEDVRRLSEGSLLICLSCMSITSKKSIQVIKYLKLAGIPIAWGGIHATLNPKECIKHADIVCVGEGEEAVLELATALKNGKRITNIKNLWVNHGGKVYKNKLRPLIKNINTLPFPDYNFESQYVLVTNRVEKMQEKYLTYGEHNPSNNLLIITECFITAHTTRGCPYSCEFCCNRDLQSIYKNKGTFVRQRSVRNVIQELSVLKRKFPRLKFLWFTDDDFFLRSPRNISLFSKLYKEEVNIPFMCYVNPSTFSEEKLKLLLDCGLYIVEIGIQTGSIGFNQKINNRTYENNLIFNIGGICKKYLPRMFPPVYQVMYTNPLETEDDTLKTVLLLRSLPRPFFLKTFNTVFFPGNAMYRKAKLLLDGELDVDRLFYVNYYDYLSHSTLKKRKNLYPDLILHYMSGFNGQYRSGIIPNFVFGFLLSEKVVSFNKKSDFIIGSLLMLPALNNIIWLFPKKYRGLCLSVVIKIEKFKKYFKTFLWYIKYGIGVLHRKLGLLIIIQ
jgi:radical SAM superfamily enzyme YgiQ (UPF0313 family)